MRKILGTFGKILRDLKISDEEKKFIKKSFDYKIYIGLSKSQQNLSKTISKWVAELVVDNLPKAQATTASSPTANVGNGNGNGNEDLLIIKEEEEKSINTGDKKSLILIQQTKI